MAFFGNFFNKKSKSAALIDIGSGSVGGAYAHFGSLGERVIDYTARIDIRPQGEETLAAAMLRTLSELDEKLIREGAPALRQATGSGSVESVLVSVGSPWQETSVRTEHIEEQKPFTFTRSLMRARVAKTAPTAENRLASGELVIATMLNGYQTNNPFGRSVKFADVIVLSSTLDGEVAGQVRDMLQKTYRSHTLTFAAFASLAYTVFRDVYPHEKDFLVLDVSAEATDVVFVRQGLLAGVMSAPVGVTQLMRSIGKGVPLSTDIVEEGNVRVARDTEGTGRTTSARAEWVKSVLAAFKEFSEEHPLPRTMFLLADAQVREYLRHALDDASFHSLWLSDEPLSILPVLPANFLPYVKMGPAAEGDIFLMLLALFYGKQTDTLE